MSIQWDATFSGFFVNSQTHRVDYTLTKKKITVFEIDRDDAVREVERQAKLYGYVNVTIDHITRIG